MDLTAQQLKFIKNLGIKRKVNAIIGSDLPDEGKLAQIEGLISEARRVDAERNKIWRKDNPEKVKAYKNGRREKHNAYSRDRMNKYYKANKAEAIKMAGGCCCITGRTKNLDWAHRDPKTKKFNVNKKCHLASFFTNLVFQEELAKCTLLCRSAHLTYDRGFASLYPQTDDTFYKVFIPSYLSYLASGTRRSYRSWLRRNPPKCNLSPQMLSALKTLKSAS